MVKNNIEDLFEVSDFLGSEERISSLECCSDFLEKREFIHTSVKEIVDNYYEDTFIFDEDEEVNKYYNKEEVKKYYDELSKQVKWAYRICEEIYQDLVHLTLEDIEEEEMEDLIRESLENSDYKDYHKIIYIDLVIEKIELYNSERELF